MTRSGRWRSLFFDQGSGWLGERRFPQKVTAVYVVCAVFSLYMADRYIHPYFPAPVDDTVYVSFTAFILYRILRGGVRTLRAKESALRESEDRLARILETNAGGIVVFDAEGSITFANRSGGEDPGRRAFAAHRPPPRRSGMGDNRRGRRADRARGAPLAEGPGHPGAGVRRPIRRPARTERRSSCPSTPRRSSDSSNEIVGTVASFADITAAEEGGGSEGPEAPPGRRAEPFRHRHHRRRGERGVLEPPVRHDGRLHREGGPRGEDAPPVPDLRATPGGDAGRPYGRGRRGTGSSNATGKATRRTGSPRR